MQVYRALFAILMMSAMCSPVLAAEVARGAQKSACQIARDKFAVEYGPVLSTQNTIRYMGAANTTAVLRYDIDCDGALQFDEYWAMSWEGYDWMDINRDGLVSRAEYMAPICGVKFGNPAIKMPASCERQREKGFLGAANDQGMIDRQSYRKFAQKKFKDLDRDGDGALRQVRTKNGVEYR
jgi:hypothetical protein